MVQNIRQSVADANGIQAVRNNRYTILVDGNNLLKISVVDKHMNSNGESYGGVYRFLRSLQFLLAKRDFSRCYVCWDGYQSGILRWEYYKDYKANRDKSYEDYSKDETDYDKYIREYCKKVMKFSKENKKLSKAVEDDDISFERQRSILMEILDNLYVRQMMFERVEGDDIMAYYVQHRAPNEKIVIVSGDRDITQLINEDVCVYQPREKRVVSDKNSVDILGVRYDNVALMKTVCGDDSDNIKGIKGVGETTFIKYFPEVRERKVFIDDIIEKARLINEERVNASKKKPPLKCLENVVNKVTDGLQGKDVFDINRKIIDLSEPLLTDEAVEEIKMWMENPLDPEGRDIRSLYDIINKHGMYALSDEKMFGEIFGPFERIKNAEIRNFKEEQKV